LKDVCRFERAFRIDGEKLPAVAQGEDVINTQASMGRQMTTPMEIAELAPSAASAFITPPLLGRGFQGGRSTT
jgi:hypothetical protein